MTFHPPPKLGTFQHIETARARIRFELNAGDGETSLRDCLVFVFLFASLIWFACL